VFGQKSGVTAGGKTKKKSKSTEEKNTLMLLHAPKVGHDARVSEQTKGRKDGVKKSKRVVGPR